MISKSSRQINAGKSERCHSCGALERGSSYGEKSSQVGAIFRGFCHCQCSTVSVNSLINKLDYPMDGMSKG